MSKMEKAIPVILDYHISEYELLAPKSRFFFFLQKCVTSIFVVIQNKVGALMIMRRFLENLQLFTNYNKLVSKFLLQVAEI